MGGLFVSCLIVWAFFILWGALTKDPKKKEEIKQHEKHAGWGGFKKDDK